MTDPDALYAYFHARAAGLAQGSVGGADALIAEIAELEISETTFRPLAAAIGKATGLDPQACQRNIVKARRARDNTGAQEAGINATANPAPLARVLDAIALLFRSQVWCSEEQIDTMTLFTPGTYGYQQADVYPRLGLTSEMRRCGKTTALNCISHLAFSSELADNVSPAAMFRLIASKPMTLCIDELDSFGRDDSGLRNILNAGYARTGTVKRCEPSPDGKTYVVVDFPCFCPVAFAGIGGLPDTVLDRSIVVRLQRAPRAGAQRPRRLRHRELLRYRNKIVPHLLAHAPAIGDAIAKGATSLPKELDDRALDNWDPLIAVADLADGPWPARARTAAIKLSGSVTDRAGLVEKLLEDIREIIEAPRRRAVTIWLEWRAGDRNGPRPAKPQVHLPTEIRTADLMALLLSMAHRPWPELTRGRPITERWLSDRLRGLDVTPGRSRVPAWPFDLNGDPQQHPNLSMAFLKNQPQLPQRRTYAISELRAACRRCL